MRSAKLVSGSRIFRALLCASALAAASAPELKLVRITTLRGETHHVQGIELAELGLVSPRGQAPEEWQLPAAALPRLAAAGRLMRDLGINVSGAALAVELLEAQRSLERQIRRLERLIR